jgi:tripartite-type tricarboxylate transporter receptor subunit TctC
MAMDDSLCSQNRKGKKEMSLERVSRRGFLHGLGAAVGAVFIDPWGRGMADNRACQQVAGRKIRWLVPFSPGGGFDIYSRLIAPFYERRIGARIVVENMPGAGGILASKRLKEADPDGLTLGILDAPGLLVAALNGEVEAPNPFQDFTILGRVVRSQHIWAAGSNSPFQSIDDVLSRAKKRSILFGISQAGSTAFVDIAVASHLLGIDAEFITGYRGSRSASLAAMRGEVDLVAYSFESIFGRIEAGDLRPLVQISVERIAPHPSLEGVPLLGGAKGLATLRASELGRDVEKARANARTLAGLIGAGRLVAAPIGLADDLFRCMEHGLYEVLTDQAFKDKAAAARRSLEPARAASARDDIQTAAHSTKEFISIIQEAIKKVRG